MPRHGASFFAIVSALGFGATPASAADISPAPYDWSGFYFGVNAGAAWNNSEFDNDIGGDENVSPELYDQVSNSLSGDDIAFTGGAMVGYNWQVESLVLGVEADINYLGFSDESERAGETTLFPGHSFTNILSFEADWFGTLRGRLGFAADNFLFYGTGGLAYGHLEASSDLSYFANDSLFGRWQGSADDVNWGWTVGGGFEYGIDNWSLGAEYLYVDLGDADWKTGDDLDIFQETFSSATVDYQFSVVRTTLKYRF